MTGVILSKDPSLKKCNIKSLSAAILVGTGNVITTGISSVVISDLRLPSSSNSDMLNDSALV